MAVCVCACTQKVPTNAQDTSLQAGPVGWIKTFSYQAASRLAIICGPRVLPSCLQLGHLLLRHQLLAMMHGGSLSFEC